MRGAMSPEMGRAENVAKKIKIELEKRGLLNVEPLAAWTWWSWCRCCFLRCSAKASW